MWEPPALSMESRARVWIKRLFGLSIVLILVFIVTYGDSTDRIIEKMNVEENNLLQLESEETGNVELKKLGLYTIVTNESNDFKIEQIKLFNQENEEIDGVITNSFERMNKRPNINGKLVYIPVLIFDVPEDGEYQLVNEGNNSIWILDDLEVQSSLISDSTILISMVSCCFGFPIGIISLIGGLIIWRRGNKPKQKLLIDDEIMTTDELFKQYNSSPENKVPAPFVDYEKVDHVYLSQENDELNNTNQSQELADDKIHVKEDSHDSENSKKWKSWDDGD